MFEFLDHPSETLIEVRGATEEEIFRDAARALFEIMTDTSRVKVESRYDVALEASGRQYLLIDWLNRLILLHEVENVFLCEFNVRLERGEVWKLNAQAGGEKVNESHERRSHAKSATFGLFEWKETEGHHRVRFVIDI